MLVCFFVCLFLFQQEFIREYLEYLLMVEGKNVMAVGGDPDAKDAGVQILGFSSTSQKEEGHGVAKKAESDVLLQVA